MELNEFIENFKNQFDDPNGIVLTPEAEFRETGDWNSLTGLMTIAMADEVYGVILTPEELRSAMTVKDLFDVIKSKQ